MKKRLMICIAVLLAAASVSEVRGADVSTATMPPATTEPATTQPSTTQPEVDAALWRRILEIDARAATIRDLVADFEQAKHTPMHKRPLISRGIVRANSLRMLWDTRVPAPTVMCIDETSAAIYYPTEKVEEIYPITGQLGALAASPLPRVSLLQKHFRFAPASVKELDPSADASKCLAVQLTPIDEALREHIEKVRVLIDAEHGFMIRCEMTDSDGDRTVISFRNVRINSNLDESQLTIHLPPGVKVVRPLENLGSSPAPASSRPGMDSRNHRH